MTTELEKQFFDTFGIEPQTGIGLVKFKEAHYPQITDSILLNLVLIMNPWGVPIGANVQEVKKHILELSMQRSREIKTQVQQLFKEKR